jgi:hydrogenase expression/formation protein HypE
VVLLSGTIGDHGVAVLSQRESLEFETTIVSDTAALHTAWWRRCWPPCPRARAHAARPHARRPGHHAQRDRAPVRRGHAAATRRRSPCKPQVEAACELLGLDPLYIANEGKLVAIVRARPGRRRAGRAARAPAGPRARIGVVQADAHHFVQMATRFGGRRVVDWLSGEPLPRIC